MRGFLNWLESLLKRMSLAVFVAAEDLGYRSFAPDPEFITRDEWFSLPLSLRQRWWAETDYSRLPPSDELRWEIDKALDRK